MLICGTMAFEDRSSPSAATSPHNDNGRTTENKGIPNSPESTRTSPYTCTTLPQSEDHHVKSPLMVPRPENDKPFFRITSYALSSHHTNTEINRRSPPSSPNTVTSGGFLFHQSQSSPEAELPSPRSPCDSVRSFSASSHCSSTPSPSRNAHEEPTIQTLKYSIRNILQPDFGKSAVLKTKSQPKIGFKPYENRTPEAKLYGAAPLGSLCQAVSQIGSSTRVPEAIPRPKSPAKPVQVEETKGEDGKVPTLWPAWVYCTRYSDRPSSGPRSRRIKKPGTKASTTTEDKRPRTAFSGAQLARLKHEFAENRYLTERRRQQLSAELGLNEAQIKIWFQNKRAKIKKASGQKNPLALQLMAQGLYNHSTVPCDEDDMPMSS